MGQAANQTKGVARKVEDWLYRMGEEMRDKLQNGIDMAKDDIQRVTEMLKDEVSKLNEVVVMAPNGTGKVGGHEHDGANGGITYTDSLNRWEAELNQLAGLNENELVTKANKALAHMAAKLQQGPAEPREVGAKKLNNGGIVYKFDKPETAS